MSLLPTKLGAGKRYLQEPIVSWFSNVCNNVFLLKQQEQEHSPKFVPNNRFTRLRFTFTVNHIYQPRIANHTSVFPWENWAMVNVKHSRHVERKKYFIFLCFNLAVSWVMLDQLAQRKSLDFATLPRIGT